MENGRSRSSSTIFARRTDLAHNIEDKEQIVGLLRILGSVVASRGNNSKQYDYYQEGLKLAQQINNREQICVLLSN